MYETKTRKKLCFVFLTQRKTIIDRINFKKVPLDL